MTQRSPLMVFLLPIVTLGIYSLYWLIKSKDEMNEQGAQIPTAWLLLVPIANLWWTWKFCEGVGHVTNNDTSPGLALVLMLLLGNIGMAVIQSGLNKRALAPAMA